MRKKTNTNQHVESSGTSSKANSSLGEAKNNEAIAPDSGERNFGLFIIQQNLLSPGVPLRKDINLEGKATLYLMAWIQADPTMRLNFCWTHTCCWLSSS